MPPGRTSMPGLQATDLLATLLACSGRRHNQLCRLSHECKLGDQTKDDADREPREERSCGRSQTSLYNCARTHRSLNKDAPVSRPVQRTGVISSRAILGGLHHRYARESGRRVSVANDPSRTCDVLANITETHHCKKRSDLDERSSLTVAAVVLHRA